MNPHLWGKHKNQYDILIFLQEKELFLGGNQANVLDNLNRQLNKNHLVLPFVEQHSKSVEFSCPSISKNQIKSLLPNYFQSMKMASSFINFDSGRHLRKMSERYLSNFSSFSTEIKHPSG